VQPKSNWDVSKRPKDLWRLKPIMIYQLFIYIVVMSRETKQYTNKRVCRKAICNILNNLAERQESYRFPDKTNTLLNSNSLPLCSKADMEFQTV